MNTKQICDNAENNRIEASPGPQEPTQADTETSSQHRHTQEYLRGGNSFMELSGQGHGESCFTNHHQQVSGVKGFGDYGRARGIGGFSGN